MNKKEAILRREVVAEIVLSGKENILRSVRDWEEIVDGYWHDGIGEAPHRSTIKRVLEYLAKEGFVKRVPFERGYFRQMRYLVRKSEEWPRSPL